MPVILDYGRPERTKRWWEYIFPLSLFEKVSLCCFALIWLGNRCDMVMDHYLSSHRPDAKVMCARADVQDLQRALEKFNRDTARYPTSSEWLNALVKNPGAPGWAGPYIEKVPIDPWGCGYIYTAPELTGQFNVRSAGPDMTIGTADDISQP